MGSNHANWLKLYNFVCKNARFWPYNLHFALRKNILIITDLELGDVLYIYIFRVLDLRIDEIVALLLCYCLSSLYRLTHPGQ